MTTPTDQEKCPHCDSTREKCENAPKTGHIKCCPDCTHYQQPAPAVGEGPYLGAPTDQPDWLDRESYLRGVKNGFTQGQASSAKEIEEIVKEMEAKAQKLDALGRDLSSSDYGYRCALNWLISKLKR